MRIRNKTNGLTHECQVLSAPEIGSWIMSPDFGTLTYWRFLGFETCHVMGEIQLMSVDAGYEILEATESELDALEGGMYQLEGRVALPA